MATTQDETRIVCVGKSGNGKSSTSNTLLHSRSFFHATQSAASVTSDCKAGQYRHTDNHGRQKLLTVVDTPGFFDTDKTITNEKVEKKIASQIFEMTSPGIHAFLIVIRIGRFTPEEKNTVDFIRHIFGPEAVKYCIIVFTGEDHLEEGQTLNEFIDTSEALRELVQACGGRTFAINNQLNGQPLQRKTSQLIEKIDDMIKNNNGRYYTNDEYQRIEKKRQKENQKKDEEERRKKKAEEDAIVARTREEERKKNEERRKLTSESSSDPRSRDDNSGFNMFTRALESTASILGTCLSPTNNGMGTPSSPISSGMEMSSERMSLASYGTRGAHSDPFMSGHMPTRGAVHGGPFMGGHMPTRGAVHGGPFMDDHMPMGDAGNDSSIYGGIRGGHQFMSPSGHRGFGHK